MIGYLFRSSKRLWTFYLKMVRMHILQPRRDSVLMHSISGEDAAFSDMKDLLIEFRDKFERRRNNREYKKTMNRPKTRRLDEA